MIVKCKQTYLDTCRIVEGTTADVQRQLDGVQLRIRSAGGEGSEVHPGETIHVPQADFQRLWEEVSV